MRRERFESSRSDDLSLSSAKTIYVFRCIGSGLYAFTADPRGEILPSRIYPQIYWRLERSVTLSLNNNSPKGKIVRAILDAIAKHGFHLAHTGVDAELLAFTLQCYDERIDSPNDESNAVCFVAPSAECR
jgi:hypothetical protein